MSQRIVTRSNGEEVILTLSSVDRQKLMVVIEIAEYNARFMFYALGGIVKLLPKGSRQQIDPNLPALLHVSQSVYAGMAEWAGSILNSKRS